MRKEQEKMRKEMREEEKRMVEEYKRYVRHPHDALFRIYLVRRKVPRIFLGNI